MHVCVCTHCFRQGNGGVSICAVCGVKGSLMFFAECLARPRNTWFHYDLVVKQMICSTFWTSLMCEHRDFFCCKSSGEWLMRIMRIFKKTITAFFRVRKRRSKYRSRDQLYYLCHICYVPLVRASCVGFLTINQTGLSSFTTFQDTGRFNSCLLAKHFDILGLKCKAFLWFRVLFILM